MKLVHFVAICVGVWVFCVSAEEDFGILAEQAKVQLIESWEADLEDCGDQKTSLHEKIELKKKEVDALDAEFKSVQDQLSEIEAKAEKCMLDLKKQQIELS